MITDEILWTVLGAEERAAMDCLPLLADWTENLVANCPRCDQPVTNVGACHDCAAEAVFPCVRCGQSTTIGVLRYGLCPQCFRRGEKALLKRLRRRIRET